MAVLKPIDFSKTFITLNDHMARFKRIKEYAGLSNKVGKLTIPQWEAVSLSIWVNGETVSDSIWCKWLRDGEYPYVDRVKTAVKRLFESNGYVLSRPRRIYGFRGMQAKPPFTGRTNDYLDFPFVANCTKIYPDQLKWIEACGWGVKKKA